ncbi:MAG: hypothetical protein E3K32_08410 [wastewater metagenome]|nr:hypothetical protein [Candidatus Loosdrechtia aerotolerans]
MMEEGMGFPGSVRVLENVSCIKCGKGDECMMSGVKMMFGPDATVTSVGVNRFENQPDAVNAARELSRKIAEVLRGTH